MFSFWTASLEDANPLSRAGMPLSVLITGCDTGFGNALAHLLHDNGYRVLAACLTPEMAVVFESHPSDRFRGFRLDVTRDADVERVRLLVEEDCAAEGLYCLVNSAGINLGSFADFTTTAQYQKVLDVNFFGVVRMCKALIGPLRRFNAHNPRKPSRIVTVTSAAALGPVPSLSAFCASKHAAEGFCYSLRYELRPWNVKVAVVQPGLALTPIILSSRNSAKEEWEAAPPHVKQYYKDGFRFLNEMKEASKKVTCKMVMDPMKGVHVLANIVMKAEPSFSNPVGIDAQIFRILRILPTIFTDALLAITCKRKKMIPEPAALPSLASETSRKGGDNLGYLQTSDETNTKIFEKAFLQASATRVG